MKLKTTERITIYDSLRLKLIDLNNMLLTNRANYNEKSINEMEKEIRRIKRIMKNIFKGDHYENRAK